MRLLLWAAVGVGVVWFVFARRGPRRRTKKLLPPPEAIDPAAARPAPRRPAARRVSLTPDPARRDARRSTVINTCAAAERVARARENGFGGQTYEALAAETAGIRAPRCWKDASFPHTDESLFKTGVAPEGWLRDGERGRVLRGVRVVWRPPPAFCGSRRPLGLNSRGEPSWLFHCAAGEGCALDARDVRQGSLGDCYFLSALALVVTDTVCADALVDDSLDAAGAYGVSLWAAGRWTMVWVDAYFPCRVPADPHARERPAPIYASSSDGREVWPMVVEKAYAKLHGCYEAIGGGGRIGAAMEALTGGTSWSLPTAVGAGKLWPGLARAVEDANVLVGAGTARGAPAALTRGIVDGHAYSVLHAVEAVDDEGATRRLLCCRNPWGRGGEWSGPWSDRSALWQRHPAIRAAVGQWRSEEDDGTFWMDVESFCQVFAAADFCRLPSSATDRRGHHRQTPNAKLHRTAPPPPIEPVLEEEEEEEEEEREAGRGAAPRIVVMDDDDEQALGGVGRPANRQPAKRGGGNRAKRKKR